MPLIPIAWSLARWGFATGIVYLIGETLIETTENVQETVSPTTPQPDGRPDTTATFSIPLSVSIVGVTLAATYAYDTIVGKKKRR